MFIRSRLKITKRLDTVSVPIGTGVIFQNLFEPLKAAWEIDMITSRQNPLVVKLCKLSDKKYRDTERLFRFDGIKLFGEAVNFGVELEYILIKSSAVEKLEGIVKDGFLKSKQQKSCELILLSDSVFDKISEEKSSEGIICIAKYIDKIHKTVKIYNNDSFSSLNNKKILIAENIQDPGNLGTIIRSSFAFENDVLVLSNCADIYNSRVVRAAMGALFKQSIIIIPNIPDFICGLVNCGRRVLATALDESAKNLNSITLNSNDCFVIGNEGHGLSKEALDASTDRIIIPMQTGSESLNAGVAASICLWQRYSACTKQ